MARTTHPFLLPTVSGALLALTVFLGYFAPRANFPVLVSAYALNFGLYLYVLLVRSWSPGDQRWLTGLGIALRIALLFSLPNLSDDFYRFLWDGRLAAAGMHPFAHPPDYFIENQVQIPGIDETLYQKLNSQHYYTVYPPVCQAVFWLAAKVFPTSLAGGVFILKFFLLGCEIGTIALLRRVKATSVETQFSAPERSAAMLYALNPLAILEITGNCHFEGAMLCFLLAGLWAISRTRMAEAAIWWALATASKLLPLLMVPVLLVWLGWRKGLKFSVFLALALAVLFLPLLDLQVIRNIASSLNLYFRQFEFNASLYYVAKHIWTPLAPLTLDVPRTLGPILALVVILGTLGTALWRPWSPKAPLFVAGTVRSGQSLLPDRLLGVLSLYLALATTVHPWYVVPLFGISLLGAWRYPLAWTATAIFSYSHYQGGGFQEQYGWIGLEYGIVAGVLVLDLIRMYRSD